MKLIILDRDGVINEDSASYIKSRDEWIPIAGSIEAIAKLHNAGFTVVVATNQSGLARELFDLDDLEAMHEKMTTLVADAGGELSGVFYCPHHPDDNCNCRKPKVGLIDAIEREFAVSARGAIFIGDSLRDLQAAAAKNCQPILVKTGKGETTLTTISSDAQLNFPSLTVYNDLAAATNAILKSK